jgi:DNA replication protein DnaC
MNHEIIAYAKQFHLGILTNGKYSPPDGLSNEEFLLDLFRAEAGQRDGRAAAERLRLARFPSFKSFDEFDTDFQKGVTRKQLDQLAKLDWLDALYNLILIGPPGTGKTHVALAVGNAAARSGFKVAFQTMDNLVHVLKTCQISAKSSSRLRWIKKCDLLIIDELGYLLVSRAESNFFFSLVSELYENASIVITSNKGFDGWAELLGDEILATALLDRLTHRCQILNFTDQSFRSANRKQIF